LKKINIIIYIIFISFFITACQKNKKTEIDIATKWIRNIPNNVIRNKQRITLEYDIIQDNQHEKYFEILKNKYFTIINEDEYFLLFEKSPSKKYTIAIRALAHSPISNSELKLNNRMIVSLIVDKNVIYSLERHPIEGFSDDEFKMLFLHRIVLVIELDKLPRDVYVMTVYDINKNSKLAPSQNE